MKNGSVSQTVGVPAKRGVRRTVLLISISLLLLLGIMTRLTGYAYASTGYWSVPITLMSYTFSILTGGDSPMDCYYDETEPMFSMGNVSRCVVQPVARIVGGLCVTFESFCSKQSVEEWTQEFLDRNEGVTDAFVGESSVTLLGQDKDVSWRLHALVDELDEDQSRILYSSLREVGLHGQDLVGEEGFAAMRRNAQRQRNSDSNRRLNSDLHAGKGPDLSDQLEPDWLLEDSLSRADVSKTDPVEREVQGDSALENQEKRHPVSSKIQTSRKAGRSTPPLKRYREGS